MFFPTGSPDYPIAGGSRARIHLYEARTEDWAYEHLLQVGLSAAEPLEFEAIAGGTTPGGTLELWAGANRGYLFRKLGLRALGAHRARAAAEVRGLRRDRRDHGADRLSQTPRRARDDPGLSARRSDGVQRRHPGPSRRPVHVGVAVGRWTDYPHRGVADGGARRAHRARHRLDDRRALALDVARSMSPNRRSR